MEEKELSKPLREILQDVNSGLNYIPFSLGGLSFRYNLSVASLTNFRYAAIASAKPARIEQDNYTVNSLHDLSPRITFSKTAAWNSSGRRDILVF